MKMSRKSSLILIVVILVMPLFSAERVFAYSIPNDVTSRENTAANSVLTNYCPTGQTPGDPGCTFSYATITQLIAALSGMTGDGTIYFTSSYSTNDLVFDQSNTDLSNLGALTIQGGWNGATGDAFALSGNTTFNGVGLTIINWAKTVTINDIAVNKNKNGDGININSYSDIDLKNITSNGNNGLGVSLNNCNWVMFDCKGEGHVTISGTNTFNRNTGFGVEVYAAGDINVNNITAKNNGSGVGLRNFLNPGGNVNVTGINTFSNNDDGYGGGVGLGAQSNGEINLNNITADNNSQFGLFLENNIFGGTGNILISGVNTFNKNGWGGVNAVSNGDILIENVLANNNGGDGFGLGASGNIDITCGILDHNSGYGVAASISGTMTLNGVILQKNDLGESFIYGEGTLVENPYECN
jgi:hypothetical protein